MSATGLEKIAAVLPFRTILAALGSTLVLITAPAIAQQPAPAAPGAKPAQAAAQPRPAAPAKPAGEVKAAGGEKASGGEAALRQRVEQLEEQLVDLQVVVGTLQSLAQSGAANTAAAGAASRGSMSPADSARLDALETQMRAIASQLEQVSGQPARSAPPPAPRSDATAYPASPTAFAPPAQPSPPAVAAPPAPSYGPKTVVSDSLDPIGGLIESEGVAAGPSGTPATGTMRPDSYAPGALPTGPPATTVATGPAAASPKQLYEEAYGHLLRQDYGAAQSGFTDFLRQFPRDTRAPDALFWLGETHYVQRNYSDAAEAFDLVTSSFSTSIKAPEAQLRRAMALAQSGKRNDACTAFRQFTTKYPNAKADLKTRAESERQRVGCT